METFNVHTLGCGSARPSLKHNPSSTVVDFRENLFMIDCGEGAQQALMRQHLKFSRLGHIFLTHLHGDHVFGLPGLIGTFGLSSVGGEVTIHTFKDGKKILTDIFDYFNRGLPFEVKFNVIEPEDAVIYESTNLLVRTVRLNHKIPAVGYIFEEKPRLRHIKRDMCDFHGIPIYMFNRIKSGEDFVKPDGSVIKNDLLTSPAETPRKYAHISDTSYMPDLAERIGPLDLLFHETTYTSDLEQKALERGHSTARQAAMVARDARAGKLLTGHYSSRYIDESSILDEARQIFPDVILNKEGLIIPVR